MLKVNNFALLTCFNLSTCGTSLKQPLATSMAFSLSNIPRIGRGRDSMSSTGTAPRSSLHTIWDDQNERRSRGPSWLRYGADKLNVIRQRCILWQLSAASVTENQSDRQALSAGEHSADRPGEDKERQLEKDESNQAFNWSRQWYPVLVLRDIEAADPRKPHRVELLGEAMVVWKDASGEWKAFTDRCPHRWAPLSEGRVDQDSGRLQCIYHGWEFEGDGTCDSIPQADANVKEAAQRSKRACATVIPTCTAQGKLWLWPDASPEGVRASRENTPVVVEEIEGEDFGGQWYMRDLPYGFDTLTENLVDASHIPFAHHGVMSNRAMGSPMGIGLDKDVGKDSIKTLGTGYGPKANYMVIGFEAPGLVYYRSDYTNMLPVMVQRLPPFLKTLVWIIKTFNLDRKMFMKAEDRKGPNDRLINYFVGYPVPVAPGRSKLFTMQCRNFFLPKPVIPRKLRNSTAKEHLQQHLVVEGDGPALHFLERSIATEGKTGTDADRLYYMPTDADTTVRAYRKWLSGRGGGGPRWAKGVDGDDLGPILGRYEMLERLESHTKQCSACNKAYQVSQALKKFSAAGALVLLAAAAAVPRGLWALGLVGGALSSIGLSVAMDRRAQRYTFVDYVHALRDG